MARSGTFKATPALREHRMRAGLDIPGLAELADTSPQQLSYVELGRRGAKPPLAGRISNALGMTLGQALERGLFVAAEERTPDGTLSQPHGSVPERQGGPL